MKAVLVFDPSSDGHHAGYILNLMRYIKKSQPELFLQMLVSEDFVVQHEDLLEYSQDEIGGSVNWWTIDSNETEDIHNAGSSRARGNTEWSVLSRHSKMIKHDHVLHMYADYIVYPLAMRKKMPRPVTGILFRQNLHYPKLFGTRFDTKETLNAKAKGKLLEMSLRNPTLQNYLCLDSFLPGYYAARSSPEKMTPCPDPVYVNGNGKNDGMLQFAPKDERKRILLFGVISQRKGFAQFLEHASQLEPDELKKLTFHVVGPTKEPEEERRIEQLRDTITDKGGCILRENKFVKDNDIQPYFDCADYIAAPYERHLGMSAILVRAAMAGKPVIASNFGLMGKLTELYCLGSSVDTANTVKVREVIRECAHGNDVGYERESADEFAQMNDIDSFGRTIFGSFEPDVSSQSTLPLSKSIAGGARQPA